MDPSMMEKSLRIHAEVYRGRKIFGQCWRFRVYGGNGEPISNSEAYENYDDCLATAQELMGPDRKVTSRDVPND
jgi:uncharacterized protein YegP (UPF0339 family)